MSIMDKINAKSDRKRRIGVFPIDGFAIMSYASLVEPIRAANILSPSPLYEVVNFGLSDAPAQSSGPASVAPQEQVGAEIPLDYLFVIAGGDPSQFRNRRVATWLSRMARLGVPLGGVSGGPIILAQAGLMGGKRMTVHWEHREALAEVSPHLVIERSLYVIDRDRLTCAGGTAPMDMMLALITQHHGARFARQVSDWYMHTEIRPSGGPQRAGLVERVGVNIPAILDAVAAMEDHVSDPLALEDLAQIAGLSERQLNRLFQDKLQTSTMRYYRNLRLEKARSLLRNTALPLTGVALATGFASSSHFSRSYSARYGQAPSQYR